MIDLNQLSADFTAILRTEQAATIQTRSDLEAKKLRRKDLRTLVSKMQNEVSTLSGQLGQLPRLPIGDLMDWAEDVLAMREMAILVLDTTSLNDHADILRFYAIDSEGEVIIDLIVKPLREQDPNTTYTGITQEEIDNAPTLEEAWPTVLNALKGRFVVAFNLDEFLEARLKDNIAHYGLSRLLFRAEDLMYQAKSYFSIGNYGYKLTDLCSRIGYTLPFPALAPDRAQAMLALLKAMANGVTSAPSAPATQDDELDHSF
jgi:DNA polymerase III alpha subunit (gram-positive type)